MRLCSTLSAIFLLQATTPCFADVLLIASQGTKLYRVQYQGDAAISQEYDIPFGIIGMTRVPVGSTIFGANSGAIIAVRDQPSNQEVYRVYGVATGAPELVRIGTLPESTYSPVFVGRRLFGVYGESGTVRIREYNASTGATLSEWNTSVPEGSGGLAYRPAERSLYFVSDVGLWKVPVDSLGQPATRVGSNFPVELNKMGLDAFGPPERPTLFIAAQTLASDPGSFFLSRLDWNTGEIESPPIAEFPRRLSIAVVSAAAIPCGADFNEDEFVDFFDYLEFVTCFEGACPEGKDADTSEDGFVDFFDYAAFVTAFESGC
jgi:hypothetical protein